MLLAQSFLGRTRSAGGGADSPLSIRARRRPVPRSATKACAPEQGSWATPPGDHRGEPGWSRGRWGPKSNPA